MRVKLWGSESHYRTSRPPLVPGHECPSCNGDSYQKDEEPLAIAGVYEKFPNKSRRDSRLWVE